MQTLMAVAFPPIGGLRIAVNPLRAPAFKGELTLTRYRIYRNSAGKTTYISAHEGSKLRDPHAFPDLDTALAVLRQGGIPEYEIRRVTKELAAINGAIVQTPESIALS